MNADCRNGLSVTQGEIHQQHVQQNEPQERRTTADRRAATLKQPLSKQDQTKYCIEDSPDSHDALETDSI